MEVGGWDGWDGGREVWRWVDGMDGTEGEGEDTYPWVRGEAINHGRRNLPTGVRVGFVLGFG